MRRFAAAAALYLGLAACNEVTEEQKTTIANRLPAGCQLRDLGSFADVNHVIMVRCEGKPTETASHGDTATTTQPVPAETLSPAPHAPLGFGGLGN